MLQLDRITLHKFKDIARSNAILARESCQVRNEAALSGVRHVPLATWHFLI